MASRWSDEDGSELAKLVASWSASHAVPQRSRFVGVISDHEMVGGAVGARRPWRFSHPLESRPQLSGDVVVAMGAGELFALHARSGELIWTRKAFGALRGAGDDGETTIISLASLDGRRSVVLAIGRDGAVVRQLYEKSVVGIPVVSDSFAFLPYERHTVVIFDLVEGSEVARVVSSRPVSHAEMMGGALYFGEDEALRFDEQVVEARSGGGSAVSLPGRIFPGSPRWLRPGATPQPLMADRNDSVRYLAWPVNSAAPPEIDRYALVYHRLVLGLEAPAGALRWVASGEDSIIGAAPTADGFALCDAAGRLRWLHGSDGSEQYRWSVGERLLACSLQGGPAVTVPGTRSASLARQIYQAVTLPDQRLLPMQLTLVDELAAIAGDESTGLLIDLAARTAAREARPDRPARSIATRALGHLAGLTSGRHAIGRALRYGMPAHRLRRTSDVAGMEPGGRWWRRTQHPRVPLAVLARAAERLALSEASPFLADYLGNPTLSPDEVQAVARALAALAGPAATMALLAHLARHRCTPQPPALAAATLAVAATLARLGYAGRVVKVATESCDHGPMRKRLLAAAGAPARVQMQP